MIDTMKLVSSAQIDGIPIVFLGLFQFSPISTNQINSFNSCCAQPGMLFLRVHFPFNII